MSLLGSNALIRARRSSGPVYPDWLKSYWAFDGESLVDLIGGKTLTWTGTPAYDDGIIGDAAAFGGASDLSTPDHEDLRARDGFSVGFWLRTSSSV